MIHQAFGSKKPLEVRTVVLNISKAFDSVALQVNLQNEAKWFFRQFSETVSKLFE